MGERNELAVKFTGAPAPVVRPVCKSSNTGKSVRVPDPAYPDNVMSILYGKVVGSDTFMMIGPPAVRVSPALLEPVMVIVTVVSPVVNGVPVIWPFEAFKDTPGGKPTAE